MNNKKGFTLVELLAVIVILGIISIIATMSVNKVIKSSRTKAFDETALIATKAAKKALLSENGNFEAAFKEEMDYDDNEYDFEIEEHSRGYKITLYAKSDGKFKNINLNELTKRNSKFSYDTQKISFWIDSNSGKLTTERDLGGVVSGDDPPEVIGGDDPPDIGNDPPINEEDNKIGKDAGTCVASEKQSLYIVGDKITLCGASGNPEEFMVIAANSSEVSLFAKYGVTGTTEEAFQSKDRALSKDTLAAAKTLATSYASYIKKNIFNDSVDVTGRIVEADEVFSGKSYTYIDTFVTLYNRSLFEDWYLNHVSANDKGYWACNELKQTNSGRYFYYAVTDGGTNSIRETRFNQSTSDSYKVRPVITIPKDAIIKK